VALLGEAGFYAAVAAGAGLELAAALHEVRIRARPADRPVQRGDLEMMRDYPAMAVQAGHVEPAPRRVRGVKGGEVLFDTTEALYLWEWAGYPQYVIPATAIDPGRLAGLRHKVIADGPGAGHVRLSWDALDAWYEEDERIHVHPRNPYTRVDALRSSRAVRIELDGVLLAESSAPVLVFETGLPTRYYLDRTSVHFAHLETTATVTECPYKGRTSGYWTVITPLGRYEDLAWTYDFTTPALAPIAGLVAFYNEQVDITLDGRRLERPGTHFFR
jgi:uncharacterized protein (DUF427 family)